MKTKLIAIMAIVAVFAAALLMGCVEKDAPVIGNVEFRNIAADAADDLAYQLEDIATAQDNGDFVTAKMELAALDTLLKRYITDFEEINVAENTLPCKKALIIAFEETQILGDQLEDYLENPTVDEYVQYNMQAINVTTQTEIVATLAENL